MTWLKTELPKLLRHVGLLENQKKMVKPIAEEVLGKAGLKKQKFLIGTMVDIPRAARTADRVATEVEFFSLGTYDVGQLVKIAVEKGRATRPEVRAESLTGVGPHRFPTTPSRSSGTCLPGSRSGAYPA